MSGTTPEAVDKPFAEMSKEEKLKVISGRKREDLNSEELQFALQQMEWDELDDEDRELRLEGVSPEDMTKAELLFHLQHVQEATGKDVLSGLAVTPVPTQATSSRTKYPRSFLLGVAKRIHTRAVKDFGGRITLNQVAKLLKAALPQVYGVKKGTSFAWGYPKTALEMACEPPVCMFRRDPSVKSLYHALSEEETKKLLAALLEAEAK